MEDKRHLGADKESYLELYQKLPPLWKKRWCSLRGNCLFVFKEKGVSFSCSPFPLHIFLPSRLFLRKLSHTRIPTLSLKSILWTNARSMKWARLRKRDLVKNFLSGFICSSLLFCHPPSNMNL